VLATRFLAVLKAAGGCFGVVGVWFVWNLCCFPRLVLLCVAKFFRMDTFYIKKLNYSKFNVDDYIKLLNSRGNPNKKGYTIRELNTLFPQKIKLNPKHI
jgi:hypothetical protein